jgi:putative oxidoreductase
MSNNAIVTLVGRILLSLLFIISGYFKLTALSGTAGYFGQMGLPVPMVLAIVVGLLEFFGGLAILVGFQTPTVAVVMGLFTIATAFVGHFSPFDLTNFFKNMGIAGGFFVLAQYGAGALSIDAKRGR